MREDMHGMDLQVLDDNECSSLEQFNAEDMICTKGRPPRYDSACNVSSNFVLQNYFIIDKHILYNLLIFLIII